jgi:hypothetical protein
MKIRSLLLGAVAAAGLSTGAYALDSSPNDLLDMFNGGGVIAVAGVGSEVVSLPYAMVPSDWGDEVFYDELIGSEGAGGFKVPAKIFDIALTEQPHWTVTEPGVGVDPAIPTTCRIIAASADSCLAVGVDT